MDYLIDEQQLAKIRLVAHRLFTEDRMYGDEMRDAAQSLMSVVLVVEQIQVPPDVTATGRKRSKPALQNLTPGTDLGKDILKRFME